MTDIEIQITDAADTPAVESGGPVIELTGKLTGGAGGQPQQVRRPARGLIGWMSTEAAGNFLNANMGGAAITSEQLAKIQAAQAVVAARDPFVYRSGVVSDAPTQLSDQIKDLGADAAAMSMANEGWAVKVVDLTGVCGFQPVIYSDSASDRVRGVNGDDLLAIARVTLPVGVASEFTQMFDPIRSSWVISSRNPNLRVLGPVGGPLRTPQGTVPGFGFFITVTASFMQVAEFEGRYFLRDGYHRAMGLLGNDIGRVPAFVRHFNSIEELIPPNMVQGMLPQAAFRGAHPPFLGDYLNDEVAASARLPAAQKLIVVHALELSPIG